MRQYLYSLIRYVANAERMEPINVGLLVSADGRTEVRFSPHAAKRSDVDTSLFRRWKDFLVGELESKSELALPKGDPRIIEHLSELATGPVLVSRRLVALFDNALSFDEVVNTLFKRLVLPVEDASSTSVSRPTQRYRQLEEEYGFLNRGMKKHAAVPRWSTQGAPSPIAWRPHRAVLNGKYTVIDKVEVRAELGRTAEEINGLSTSIRLLEGFLHSRIADRETSYVLLADPIIKPFTDQTVSDFDSMREDIERIVKSVVDAGGQVVRTPIESQSFADRLNRELPPAN